MSDVEVDNGTGNIEVLADAGAAIEVVGEDAIAIIELPEQGPQGPGATVTIGSVTTGAPGSEADVVNSGTPAAAVLEIVIPRGNTGATGPSGTMTVGSVTTGPAGSSAEVTNTGTPSAAVLNFEIPEGEKGEKGDPGGFVEHSHDIDDVTGLQAALNGKSDTGHGHIIANVTGLQAALDGKSAVGHVHAIANVTGLQTALDAKLAATGNGSQLTAVGGDGVYGLKLAWYSATAVSISVGSTRSDIGRAPMVNAVGTYVKTLNSAWVAGGAGQGGLAPGNTWTASGTIHVWMITTAAGNPDFMVSFHAQSGLSPALPSGYVFKRRIASLMLDGATPLWPFCQTGDVFYTLGNTDLNTVSNYGPALLGLTVPQGINVRPLLSLSAQQGTGGDVMQAAAPGDNVTMLAVVNATNLGADRTVSHFIGPHTNVSAQIGWSTQILGGTLMANTLTCYGWIDDRKLLS